MSQYKRNPFKRAGLSGSNSKPVVNPLSHLTDKAIGFNDSESSGIAPLDSGGEDYATAMTPTTTVVNESSQAIEEEENKMDNEVTRRHIRKVH